MVGGGEGQKVKHGKYDELERILLDWFQQACSLNYPMNGVIITERSRRQGIR